MIDEVQASAILSVDLAALVGNWRQIAAMVAPAAAAAVVKADAYGLGAIPVVRALVDAGCRHFFVAQLSEAAAILPALPHDASAYVLNGLMPGAEPACAATGAVPVLNSLDQVARWNDLARSERRVLPAILQVDSGMARMGLLPQELAFLVQERDRIDHIRLLFIASHLACADNPKNPANAAQIANFEAACLAFPSIPRTLANSGGSLAIPVSRNELVRPGLALYGINPVPADETPLQPVVSLQARIIQLRNVPAGAGVGYDLQFVAQRETRIATIGIGYADGWPYSLANCGTAYVGGVRVPFAGRVSMDSITLDVTGVPQRHLFPGALVELIGPNQSLAQVAADAGTIPYEILTRLGRRFARRHVFASPIDTSMNRSTAECA